MILRELRRRLKKIMGPALMLSLVGYFIYHIIEGNYGILSWVTLQEDLEIRKKVLNSLRIEHDKLERRTRLLKPTTLCKDLLDEQLRRLGFAEDREIVLLHNSSAPKIKK